MIALIGVALLTSTSPIVRHGVRLAGPYPTLSAAVRGARCRPVEVEAGSFMTGTRVVGAHIGRMKEPTPFSSVRLQAVNCRIRGVRDGSENVMAFVRRGDSWWRSPVLHIYGGNDKYCEGEMQARFRRRQVVPGGAPEIVIEIDARTGCVTCGKQGFEDTFEHAIVVLADTESGPPQVFPTITTAMAWTQRPMDETTNVTAPDEYGYCPPLFQRVTLAVDWQDDGTLVLSGKRYWPRQEFVKRRRSTVGRYRFELASP